MAVDLYESMMARARALRRLADQTEETAKALKRLESPGVMLDGRLVRKPNAWQVADNIEQILEHGQKSMAYDALVEYLVENNLVKGSDRATKTAAARRALRYGLRTGGYLRLEGTTVHWVSGKYENKRVRKNI